MGTPTNAPYTLSTVAKDPHTQVSAAFSGSTEILVRLDARLDALDGRLESG